MAACPYRDSICPSSFSIRVRTCLRSLRRSSISWRSFWASAWDAPAALRAAASSVKAASRSSRMAATISTVRRMRSSRLARGSSSGKLCWTAASISGFLEGSLGLRDQGAESRAIRGGKIGQALAVQLDARFLEPAHEAAVGDVRGAAGGSDAHDPQRTEIPLLQPAPDVAVAQRFFHRFLRGPVQLALGKEKTLGETECLAPVLAALDATFYSGHVFSPCQYLKSADQARAALCLPSATSAFERGGAELLNKEACAGSQGCWRRRPPRSDPAGASGSATSRSRCGGRMHAGA